ncbi:hypothetical protein KY290_010715 [Solanum tuberosum]|uniref:Uncharacterized protein n=1 Tax=Solanum tuberosum TaxID=4113 RepID=A0ABQ7W0K6_SOLTU|nr:hypothetical protein KY290_010715 [Solanum tuberosum]
MASFPPQSAATLSQPNPPTLTWPNQPATKVHPMTTRSQTHTLKPRKFLTNSTLSPKIPINNKQARLIPLWNSTMQAEFDALSRLTNEVYMQQPPGFENSGNPTHDLGPLHYFLCIEVIRSSADLLLSQEKYTMVLLHEESMDNCKDIDFAVSKLSQDTHQPFMSHWVALK